MSDVPDVAVALIVIVVCLGFGGVVYYIVRRRRKHNHNSQLPHETPQQPNPQLHFARHMHDVARPDFTESDPTFVMEKAKQHEEFLKTEQNAWLRHNIRLERKGEQPLTLEQFRDLSEKQHAARMNDY
jgi:uncharacterized protein HemX